MISKSFYGQLFLTIKSIFKYSTLFFMGWYCFLQDATAALYPMPSYGNDIIGHAFVTRVRSYDSVTKIRHRYDVSLNELVEANPDTNFYRLRVGQKIIIPAEYILPKYRRGIVINIPELRLFYFTPDGRYVYTFPVGLGRENWRTPTAAAKVIYKEAYPSWHPPDTIREYYLEKTGEVLPDVVPPGPKNPLGKYALYLSKNGYLIHGTNIPDSVGTFISSGCMRLLDDAIETLYANVGVGTQVHIVHHQVKVGWYGDTLYLESHTPIDSYQEYNQDFGPPELNSMDTENAIYQATAGRPAYVNWNLVNQAVRNHDGVPEPIGKRFS